MGLFLPGRYDHIFSLNTETSQAGWCAPAIPAQKAKGESVQGNIDNSVSACLNFKSMGGAGDAWQCSPVAEYFPSM